MATRAQVRPHGAVTRASHWGIALLVLSAWVVGSTMEGGPPRSPGQSLLKDLHYSLGMLVLGFTAFRIVWRVVAPPVPGEGPAWQRLSALAMHIALVGLSLALPLTGLLDRWARGRPVTVFGGVPLPAPFPVPGGRFWIEAHGLLANLLLAAIAAHVLAAMWHQYVARDGALSRMLPAVRQRG